MYKITYVILKEEYATELEWLRGQKIFPSTQDTWQVKKGSIEFIPAIRVGAIVDSETLLAIKLRHELENQSRYIQRK